MRKKNRFKTLKNLCFSIKWLYSISKFYVVFTILCSIISEIVGMIEHTFLVAYIIDCVQYGRSFSEVVKVLIPLTAVIVINITIYSYVTNTILPKLMEKIYREIRGTLYTKALQLDVLNYDDPEFYNDYVWAMQDAPQHVLGMLNSLSAFCSTVVLIACMGIYMVNVDLIGLCVVVASLIITYFLKIAINKRRIEMEEEKKPFQRKRDYINRVFYLGEYTKELRMSEMSGKLFDDFRNANDSIIKIVKKKSNVLWILSSLSNAFRSFISFDGVYLSYLLYKTLVLNAFSYGSMMALYNASSRLQNNLQALTFFLPQIQNHSLYIDKIRFFLNKQNLILERGKKVIPLGGTISLSHVSFAYPNTTEFALRDICLTIPSGSKIALVGYNGTGKTTLIKLIMRLYDPTEGAVLLNGVSIEEYSLEEYRRQFGVVFQNFQIMASSVLDNITMNDSQEADVDCAIKACDMVSLSDKIDLLPNGIETQLTKEFYNDGIELSGGESQKIAIARVLYSNAQIMILDEPSSALDPIAEYQLNSLIRKLAKDKTVIFISHRLSSTRLADCIYVMEKGKIIESGTHIDLINRKGKYAEMYQMQAKRYQ